MSFIKFLINVKSATIENPLRCVNFHKTPFDTELMECFISVVSDTPLARDFYFNFYDCQITDEVLQPLLKFLTSPKCPEKISLGLSENQITHHSAALLAKALNSNMSTSVFLFLSNNAVHDEGIALFTEHFKPGKNLTSLRLNFSNNGLTETCVPHLTQIISVTNSFSKCSLDISSNTITDTGAKSIIDAMTPAMANDFELDVGDNGLTSATTQHLLNRLQKFQGTQTIALDLSNNHLGDTGFNHLLQLLAATTCLARFKSINLFNCSITSDSIKPLANSINVGALPCKLELNLQGNELDLSLQLLANALVSPDCPDGLTLLIGSEDNECAVMLNESEINQFIETFKAHNPAMGLRLKVGKSGSKEQRQELKRLCRETVLNAVRCANVWMGYLQENNQFARLTPEIMARIFSFIACSEPKNPFSFFTKVTNGYNKIKEVSATSLSDTCPGEETKSTFIAS